jgi:hypothetical protein
LQVHGIQDANGEIVVARKLARAQVSAGQRSLATVAKL